MYTPTELCNVQLYQQHCFYSVIKGFSPWRGRADTHSQLPFCYLSGLDRTWCSEQLCTSDCPLFRLSCTALPYCPLNLIFTTSLIGSASFFSSSPSFFLPFPHIISLLVSTHYQYLVALAAFGPCRAPIWDTPFDTLKLFLVVSISALCGMLVEAMMCGAIKTPDWIRHIRALISKYYGYFQKSVTSTTLLQS